MGGGGALEGERTVADGLDPRNLEGVDPDCRWDEELLSDIGPNEARGQLMRTHFEGQVLRPEPNSLPPPVAGTSTHRQSANHSTRTPECSREAWARHRRSAPPGLKGQRPLVTDTEWVERWQQ